MRPSPENVGCTHVSDASNLRKVGGYEAGGNATGVVVAGRYAYVAGNGSVELTNDSLHSLTVFDIGDPANPRRVGGSERSGSASRVTVSGNVAYLANGLDGVEVFDVSNPAAPARLGGCLTGGNARCLALTGSYGLVASAFLSFFDYGWVRGEGLVVVDVRKPANPGQVGRIDLGSSVQGVEVVGPYAYLIDATGGLQVADISDSANPRFLGAYSAGERISGVAVSIPYVFVLEYWPDIDRKGQLNVRLEVIDAGDPATLRRVGVYETSEPTSDRTFRVAGEGDSVYLAESWGYNGGMPKHRSRLSVLDTRDPAKPRLLGSYTNNSPITDVVVSKQYAYVLRNGFGLEVVDVTDGANPKPVGAYRTSADLSAVSVSDHLACVANVVSEPGVWGTGMLLRVLDVSNPANPRPLGEIALSGHASSIALWGQYAYVAAEFGGMHVVDLSDPARPRRVGGNSSFVANDVAVHDGVPFVRDFDGVSILELFTPLRFGPLQVGADGILRLSLSGVSGARVRVQRSGNLADWEDWQNIILGPASSQLDAGTNGFEGRFYRAFEAPPRPDEGN